MKRTLFIIFTTGLTLLSLSCGREERVQEIVGEGEGTRTPSGGLPTGPSATPFPNLSPRPGPVEQSTVSPTEEPPPTVTTETPPTPEPEPSGGEVDSNIETLFSKGKNAVGRCSSLALRNEQPLISYQDDTAKSLKLAYKDESGWKSETVASDVLAEKECLETSIVLLRMTPYIAFHNSISDRVGVARRNSDGSWDIRYLGTSSDAHHPALVLDFTHGFLHAAFREVDKRLEYVRLHSNLASLGVQSFPTLVGGEITLSFLKKTLYALQEGRDGLILSEFGSRALDDRIIDRRRDVGRYYSIVADPTETFFLIAYYLSSSGDLNYCKVSGMGRATFCEPVDTEGDVGLYTSIGVTVEGKIYISYYDATNGDLKLAAREPNGGWKISVIDGQKDEDVGQYSSLRIDPSGHLHISYYDATNKKLKYYRSP